MPKKYWLLTLICILMIGIIGIPAAQALTNTSGVNSAGAGKALFWFKPSGGTCSYVIAHYLVPGFPQQNVYMTYNNNTAQWEYSVGSLIAGKIITYNFTYNTDGLQYDTTPQTWIVPSAYTKLVWQDEFDGSSLDTTKWNYQIGNGYNSNGNSFDGWKRAGELEWNQAANVSVSNGNLVIKGEYLNIPVQIAGHDWYQFSGRITTKGIQSWKYGRVEARIKLPTAQATWPAFRMMGDTCDATVNGAFNGYDKLPTNWASCGEIDIMEHRNDEKRISNSLYYDTREVLCPYDESYVATNIPWVVEDDVSQYHVYSMEWDSKEITWYVDDKPTMTQDCSIINMEEFRQPFFILLSMAIGGKFPGPETTPKQEDFPVYMYVDYVRVYQ